KILRGVVGTGLESHAPQETAHRDPRTGVSVDDRDAVGFLSHPPGKSGHRHVALTNLVSTVSPAALHPLLPLGAVGGGRVLRRRGCVDALQSTSPVIRPLERVAEPRGGCWLLVMYLGLLRRRGRLTPGGREREPENGARARGIHPDATAVPLDDRARNGKAHAHTGGLGSEERFEYLLVLVGRDARPGVLYGHLGQSPIRQRRPT